MAWAKRLRSLFGEQQVVPPDVAGLVTALRRVTSHLSQAADRSPNPASSEVLRRLAAEDEQRTAQLAAALETRGVRVAAAPDPASQAPAAGSNHWSRLCACLDAHRELRNRAVDLSAAVNEDDPELATVLDGIIHQEEDHIDTLLDLIARSDPQALD